MKNKNLFERLPRRGLLARKSCRHIKKIEEQKPLREAAEEGAAGKEKLPTSEGKLKNKNLFERLPRKGLLARKSCRHPEEN